MKRIFTRLNILAECKGLGLPLWQCPSFLIVLTGVVTILAMVSTYVIATKYTEPEIVALIVIGVTAVLMIVNYLIIRGFERLAEANRLKTEFVSIASHQLRTPLTGIKWAINLMMSGDVAKLDPEQAARLETIKESNQRMINLVNDLLNVSRIEQGRLGLRPEKVSLVKIINQTVKEYDMVARARNTRIIVEIKEDIPEIMVDVQGLKLVLHNLIDNAVRYTKKNGLVKIRLLKRKNNIRCEVEDNGVGIPKRDQKKIFQKFFRSENALKYQTEGTGLGLFIAKAIIDSSKGRIGFKSQENKGSTFWFELPIKT